MEGIKRHFSKVMVAGIVALLPIGGTVLGILWLESELKESIEGWIGIKYFPGQGLLVVLSFIYVTGLLVSTFLGRWMWRLMDRLLRNLPLLGTLYNTLKQVLGYGDGEDAIFRRTVYVSDPDMKVEELGLVTNTLAAEDNLVVFIPGSPMPTSGRLVIVPESAVRPSELSVKDALTALVSIGKSDVRAAAE